MLDNPKDLTGISELPADSPTHGGVQESSDLNSMSSDMSPDPEGYQVSSKQENKTESMSVKEDTGGLQDGETEYPSSWKLAIIMLGLCFAVFCMALVRERCYLPQSKHLLS